MIAGRASMRFRSLLALGLVFGFYALALGIAALLIMVIVWDVGRGRGHVPHVKLILACGIGAGLILLAIRPRFDRFIAPGPALLEGKQPRLFAVLREIARAAGQAMPVEVYLVGDVNAFVGQRGGFMGIGSRRIMGLGLPLMQVQTVSQFKATIAHEFGHYHGGDTKLGPWIYSARMAIFRTVENLDENLLQLPFRWYGNLFMWITFAVSRRQELQADELAGKIAGARALSQGLTASHRGAVSFEAFMDSEFMPVLGAGYFPPLLQGYEAFLKSPEVAAAVDKELQKEFRRKEADALDSHPPLVERIAAMEKLPPGPAPSSDPPAASLLADVPNLEREMVAFVLESPKALAIPSIEWKETGERVFLPVWKAVAKEHAAGFKGLVPPALAEVAGNLAGLGRRLSPKSKSKEEAEGFATFAAGAALASALHDRGWTVHSGPGLPIVLRKGGEAVEPFTALAELSKRTIAPDEWRRRCAAWGIEGVDLGAPALE